MTLAGAGASAAMRGWQGERVGAGASRFPSGSYMRPRPCAAALLACSMWMHNHSGPSAPKAHQTLPDIARASSGPVCFRPHFSLLALVDPRSGPFVSVSMGCIYMEVLMEIGALWSGVG